MKNEGEMLLFILPPCSDDTQYNSTPSCVKVLYYVVLLLTTWNIWQRCCSQLLPLTKPTGRNLSQATCTCDLILLATTQSFGWRLKSMAESRAPPPDLGSVFTTSIWSNIHTGASVGLQAPSSCHSNLRPWGHRRTILYPVIPPNSGSSVFHPQPSFTTRSASCGACGSLIHRARVILLRHQPAMWLTFTDPLINHHPIT